MYHIANNAIKTILPSWIYERLIGDWNKDGLKKYFVNTGWIGLARIFSLVISFLTIAIVAKYLGPENYGRLSYAQNFVALFSIFATLGIDQILYRDLVANPEKENELLGTAFFARLIFGFISILTTSIVAFIINNEPILTWMICIITITFLFQPVGVIAHVFNARVLSKYTAYITIGVALFIPGLKLLVVTMDKGILYFSIVLVVESAIYSIAYIYLYKKILHGSLFNWQYSQKRLYRLLHDSWPLLLAGLSGYIYSRIDQVMIQQLINSSAVGFYDISVKLTELLGFVPGIIIASLFPAIISSRQNSRNEYKKRFRALVGLSIVISSLSALVLFIFAPVLILKLFGTEFASAIILTRIYVWSTIGTVLILLIQQYLVAEHRSQTFLIFSILGATLNIILNLVLIPILGAAGAAYATLITLVALILSFLLWQFYHSH